MTIHFLSMAQALHHIVNPNKSIQTYNKSTMMFYYFRPSLADQHKVGFFTLDRCSQTEVTEVVELKDMTEVLQLLLKASFVYFFWGEWQWHIFT